MGASGIWVERRGSRVLGSIKIKKAVIDFEALCRLRETQNRADCGELVWLRPERKCSVTLTGWRRKCWWTELNKGGKGGWRGGGLVLWGHDTNVFHWQDGKAPLLCHTHTHTHSHKSMHLFTGSAQSKQRGHFLMHTLRNTYTNVCFKQKLVVTDSSNQRLPKCFSHSRLTKA